MRSVRSLFTVLLLGLTSAVSAQSPTRTDAAISAADMQSRIGYLASDALRGRDTPSPGLELAATYIANEFKSFGLRPAGDSGTFIQRWPYDKKQLAATQMKAELRVKDTGKSMAYLTDYFLLPSPAETVTGSIYFAGTAAGPPRPLPAEARDKFVVYYIAGAKAEGDWVQRLIAALGPAIPGGARGIVLVLDPAFGADQIAQLGAQAASQPLPIPVLGIANAAAKDWFAQLGGDLETLKTQPRALPDGTVSVTSKIETTTSRPPNVVGILPGTDAVLKDQYIVLTAHMDHVGVGKPDATGDSIFNGADDDASGTSAVIEVAQALAALREKQKRSVIFVLVSGEEYGLLGSGHFVANSPVPVNQIVANINMDMIGRNHPDSVIAIGQEFTTLGPLAHEVAKNHADLKLKIGPDPDPKENLFFRSDHFNFARKNIPAIFFTTGLHKEYHQPSDEPETIDNDKAARVAKLLMQLVQSIAASTDTPKWTEAGIAAMKAIPGGN